MSGPVRIYNRQSVSLAVADVFGPLRELQFPRRIKLVGYRYTRTAEISEGVSNVATQR